MRNLSQLPLFVKAKIGKINDQDLEQKLLEMGCTPDEEITVIRKAPFNGPLAIMVSSYMLSIRYNDACVIDIVEYGK
jgi:ferrous iron transport protein A|tara:strand:+ start:181 stop:411 length:231 start_codon:yes stop_codon:yes gene_type:complete